MKTRFTTLISVWAFILTMLLSISSCSKSNEPINPKKKTNNPANSLGSYNLYATIKNEMKTQMALPLNESELRNLIPVYQFDIDTTEGSDYETIVHQANLSPTTEQFFLRFPEWVQEGVRLPSISTINQLNIPIEEKQKIIVALALIDACEDNYNSENGYVQGDGKGNGNQSPEQRYQSQVHRCYKIYMHDIGSGIAEAALLGWGAMKLGTFFGVVGSGAGFAISFAVGGIASIIKARNNFHSCIGIAKSELDAELEARKNGGCSIIWFPPKYGKEVTFDQIDQRWVR